MKHLPSSVLVGLLLLYPSLSQAAQPSTAPDPISIQSVSQMVIGLVLVIALILFLAWALRRLNAVPGQSGKMRVIATLPLGARERAILVQVGEEQLLLGVTSQSVNILARYDTPILPPDTVPTTNDFAMKLAQVLKQRGKS